MLRGCPLDDEAMQQGRQQPGLGDHQDALTKAKADGETDPASAVARLVAQPAIKTFLSFFIHYHHPRVEWRKTILAPQAWQPCKFLVLKMFD